MSDAASERHCNDCSHVNLKALREAGPAVVEGFFQEDTMRPHEYRVTVRYLRGRKPPCIECSDEDVSHCMKTGFECVKFKSYIERVPMKEEREDLVCQRC